MFPTKNFFAGTIIKLSLKIEEILHLSIAQVNDLQQLARIKY